MRVLISALLALDVCCIPSTYDVAKGASLIVAGEVEEVTKDGLKLKGVAFLKGEGKGETFTLKQARVDNG